MLQLNLTMFWPQPTPNLKQGLRGQGLIHLEDYCSFQPQCMI